jgi:hypothetical protein
MKLRTVFTATALTLLGASAAFAQVNTNEVVQEGQYNSSNTHQRGHDNLSEKAQFGGHNRSRTRQRGEINTSRTGQVGQTNRERTDQRGR